MINTPLFDEKLNALTVYLAEWIVNKEVLHELGRCFDDKKFMEKAAYCYRLSKFPKSLMALCRLISIGATHYDLNGKPISEDEKDEVLADLCRKSKTPEGILNLAILIETGRTARDLKGKLIPEGKKDEVLADLYRESKIPEALDNLAIFIQTGRTHHDLRRNLIPEGKKDEVVANLYRQSKTREAKNGLAGLIQQGRTTRDLDGNDIPEDKRDEVAAKLYRESNTPLALCNLAFLKLSSSSGQSLEVRKEALGLFLQASFQGDEYAHLYYCLLKEDIETQKILPDLSTNSQSDSQSMLQKNEKNFIIEQPNNQKEDNEINNLTVLSSMSSDERTLQENLDKQAPDDFNPGGENWLIASKEKKEPHKLKKNARIQDKFKKILNRTFIKEDLSSLLRKSKASPFKEEDKRAFKITWSKKAKSQFESLSPEHTRKVWKLIEDIKINGKRGRPETLQGGYQSRRIYQEDRILYSLKQEGSETIIDISSCKGHYGVMIDTKKGFSNKNKR